MSGFTDLFKSKHDAGMYGHPDGFGVGVLLGDPKPLTNNHVDVQIIPELLRDRTIKIASDKGIYRYKDSVYNNYTGCLFLRYELEGQKPEPTVIPKLKRRK